MVETVVVQGVAPFEAWVRYAAAALALFGFGLSFHRLIAYFRERRLRQRSAEAPETWNVAPQKLLDAAQQKARLEEAAALPALALSALFGVLAPELGGNPWTGVVVPGVALAGCLVLAWYWLRPVD